MCRTLGDECRKNNKIFFFRIDEINNFIKKHVIYDGYIISGVSLWLLGVASSSQTHLSYAARLQLG